MFTVLDLYHASFIDRIKKNKKIHHTYPFLSWILSRTSKLLLGPAPTLSHIFLGSIYKQNAKTIGTINFVLHRQLNLPRSNGLYYSRECISYK